MQDIILVGSGGCMREIVWQMQEQNKSAENWNILGMLIECRRKNTAALQLK